MSEPRWAGRGHPGRPAGQRGMVTAELAFAGMGAALALIVMAWFLTVLMQLIRCQDVAAEVARQEARSDRVAVAKALADKPDGAVVTVRDRDGAVEVQVDLQARGWAAWLPSLPLRAEATVLREPT